jgi:glyoxylase-like metal-dependent hydrolase (beta-lactamase superfamily II)
MRLFDNLYCYIWQGKGNNCNSYLFASVLRGDRPHVMVDPGQVLNELKEPCLDTLLRGLDKDGIQPEDIGLIISTHAHYDHFGASRSLVARSRSKGGQPKQTQLAIHEAEATEYMAKVPGMPVQQSWFEPNFYLEEGELNLGKGEGRVNLQVILTPGHTPGSISLYWPDKKVLITGDLLFYGGVGRTDFGGDGKQLKQSIERLSQLDVEYVLPGHRTEFGAIIKGKDAVRQNFAAVRLNYFPML